MFTHMRRGALIAERFGFVGRIGQAAGRPFLECIDRASEQKPPVRVIVAPYPDLPFPAQQRLARHEREIVTRLALPVTLSFYDLIDTGKESFPVFASVGKLSPVGPAVRQAPYHYISRLLAWLFRLAEEAHRQGIALGFLLPEQLMTSGDGSLRIIDCSRCALLDDDRTAASPPLPQSPFVAPELMTSGRPTVASDVYALGMLSVSLFAGSIPATTPGDDIDRRRIRERLLALIRRRFDNPEWIEPLSSAIADAPGERPKDVRSFFEALLPDEGSFAMPLLPEAIPSCAARIITRKRCRRGLVAALKKDIRAGQHVLARSLSDDDLRALIGSGDRSERAEAASLLLQVWSEAQTLGRMNIIEESIAEKQLSAKARSLLQYSRALRDYLAGDLNRAASTIGPLAALHPAAKNLEGMIAQRRGNFREAAKSYGEALAAAERAGDRMNAAIYRGNLALVRQSLGEYAAALTLYDEALVFLATEPKSAALAATLCNKAGLITLCGHFGEASKLLRQSLAIACAQGFVRQEGLGLVLAAEISKFRGDFDNLEAAARKAFSLFAGLGERRQMARALIALGWGASRQGNLKLLQECLVRIRAMRGAFSVAEDLECRMLQICSLRHSVPSSTAHMLTLIAEGETRLAAGLPPPLLYEWKKLCAYILAEAGRADEASASMQKATETLSAIEASIPAAYRKHFRTFTERWRLAQWRLPVKHDRLRRTAIMTNPADLSPVFQALTQALRSIVERMPKPTQQRLFLEDIARWAAAEAVARFRFLGGSVVPTAHVGEADMDDVALEIRKRISALTAWKALEFSARGKKRTLLCAPTSSGGELTGCVAAVLRLDRRALPRPMGDLLQSAADMLEVIEMTALTTPPEPATAVTAPPPSEQKIAAAPFLFGPSAAMEEVRRLALQAAASRIPAIIFGPPGTGKRTLAEHIHSLSPADAGCEAVDCRQGDSDLLYAQLFGTRSSPGAISRKEHGTVVLLHIERLDWTMQNHLIAFLQEGCYRPSGADAFRRAATWLMATAYEKFWEAVDAGRINPHLVTLLGRLRISLPSLSERPGDMEALAAEHFELRGIRKKVNPAALQELIAAPWESNTAQLFRALDGAAALSPGASLNGARMRSVLASTSPASRSPLAAKTTLVEYLREAEKEAIESALAAYGHDKGQAARALGISVPSLYKKMKQFNLGMEKVTRQQILAALKACAGNKRQAANQLRISRKTLYNKMAEYHLKG